MPKELTPLMIEATIAPTSLRWPSAEQRKELAWDRLRGAVATLREFVRNIDHQCRQAEQDRDLNADGIARRRIALGRQGLAELESWPPLLKAEKMVADNLALLESKMTGLPPAPQNAVDALLGQEIRAYVRSQKHPVDHVLAATSNKNIMAAVLNAPAFLSGLSEAEFNLVRDKARRSLHPEQVLIQEQLTKALDDLRGGVEATKRLLRERCQVPVAKLGSKESEAVA